MYCYRGDVFYADLGTVMGSEQGGIRPVVIIQNNTGNRHSPTIIAASITSQTRKNPLPTHVSLPAGEGGLPSASLVLLEQIRTLDKDRLGKKIGSLSEVAMEDINSALRISVGVA